MSACCRARHILIQIVVLIARWCCSFFSVAEIEASKSGISLMFGPNLKMSFDEGNEEILVALVLQPECKGNIA